MLATHKNTSLLPSSRLLLLCLVASGGCKHQTPSDSATPAAARVTIVYSASLAGTLEPCGCSPDQRGGIYRAAAFVADARAGGAALYLDGGDLLFESAPVPAVKR